MSIIIFLIILAILVLVHEFGHFIVAKKSGIRVDEFGLGFPPRIFSKKFGGTMYSLNAIPFGGFVKIFGEDSHMESISEADKATSFIYKPKWVQALVLVAGVTFNMVFAWLIVSIGFMIGLPSSVDYSGFGQVSNSHLIVTEVISDSPAQKAGLETGDKITSVSSGASGLQNNNLTPEKVKNIIATSNENIKITYSRGGGQETTVFIKPNNNILTDSKAIGIAMDSIGTLKLPIHLALIEGARTTWFLTKGTAIGLGDFLWNTVKFKSDLSQISGPVGIVKVVGEANNLGFVYLLSLMALISINLAIINLLPFPALDGGRLLFILIEAIIRRPIKPVAVKWANTLGFILLVILMVVVTSHDIFKLL